MNIPFLVRHVHWDFQNVALNLPSIVKELTFLEIVRLGSFPCCLSCVQGLPSCFTPGSSLTALLKLGNISLVSLLTALPTQLLSKHLVIPAVSSQIGPGETYLSNECRAEIAASYESRGLYFFHVAFSYDFRANGFPALLSRKNDRLD